MANVFLEERLPVHVRMGAKSSESYAVEVVVTASDVEYRRLLHPFPRRSFVVDFTQLRLEMYYGVQALYHRARGKFAGFRVKCWDDYSTAQDGRSPPTMLDWYLAATAAADEFQLQKVYGNAGLAPPSGFPVRTIYKPVAGTVVVARNGVLLTPVTDYTVDTTTGIVTMVSTPAPGDVITGGCEFDLPCRFNSDLEAVGLSAEVRDCGTIDVVELLRL